MLDFPGDLITVMQFFPGLTNKMLNKLQLIQNAPGRVFKNKATRFEHISLILFISPHWISAKHHHLHHSYCKQLRWHGHRIQNASRWKFLHNFVKIAMLCCPETHNQVSDRNFGQECFTKPSPKKWCGTTLENLAECLPIPLWNRLPKVMYLMSHFTLKVSAH